MREWSSRSREEDIHRRFLRGIHGTVDRQEQPIRKVRGGKGGGATQSWSFMQRKEGGDKGVRLARVRD